MRHRRTARTARSDFLVGLAVLTTGVLAFVFAFARPDPFRHPYVMKAIVTSTGGVRAGLTPVRVAGIDVGKVSAVESYEGSRLSLMTMELDDAPPIHLDAQLKVRPRLFLEGNSFIELEPGSPGSPHAPKGYTLPLRQTSAWVTFPHVLGALSATTRVSLQQTIQVYGGALASSAPALGRALHHAAHAVPSSAVLSDASQGQSPGDLDRAIDGFGRTAQALDDSGPELGQMLAGLRATSGAFARESASVVATLRELPGALASSRGALRALNAALPPARALAQAGAAALPDLPAMFRAGGPWLGQLRKLLGSTELAPDLTELAPATHELAGGQAAFTELLRQLDLLSGCSARVLTPTANASIDDGPRTAHTTVWGEFLSAAEGIAGASQSFDGNGFALRGNPGGGATAVATQKGRQLDVPIYGNALAAPQGTRPTTPAQAPTHRSDVRCQDQHPPDLDAAPTGPADGAAR